jgi:hypothetical protein
MDKRWVVAALFPWGPGREELERCATRSEARRAARWHRRHPGTPTETTIVVEDAQHPEPYDEPEAQA